MPILKTSALRTDLFALLAALMAALALGGCPDVPVGDLPPLPDPSGSGDPEAPSSEPVVVEWFAPDAAPEPPYPMDAAPPPLDAAPPDAAPPPPDAAPPPPDAAPPPPDAAPPPPDAFVDVAGICAATDCERDLPDAPAAENLACPPIFDPGLTPWTECPLVEGTLSPRVYGSVAGGGLTETECAAGWLYDQDMGCCYPADQPSNGCTGWPPAPVTRSCSFDRGHLRMVWIDGVQRYDAFWDQQERLISQTTDPALSDEATQGAYFNANGREIRRTSLRGSRYVWRGIDTCYRYNAAGQRIGSIARYELEITDEGFRQVGVRRCRYPTAATPIEACGDPELVCEFVEVCPL